MPLGTAGIDLTPMQHRSPSALERFRALYRGPEPVGASELDVIALEREVGLRLPADYRAFLRWMGRDRNGVWRGSECFVDDIVSITRDLPDLMEENGLLHALPDRYVCVFMHQGYIATWFAVPTDSSDPAAFVFNEGQRELGIRTGETVMETFLADYRGLTGLGVEGSDA